MSGVAVASHLSCAIAFMIVTVILAGHRPTRTQFPLLIISCGATFCWAIASTFFSATGIPPYSIVTITEILSDALWFLCLIQLLKLTQRTNKNKWCFRTHFYLLMGSILLVLLVNALWMDFGWQPGKSGVYAKYTFIGYVAFSVLILALLEQIYRGSVPERRWGIRLFCIGLGLMYCYEFYMYANATLFNGISTAAWEIRGAISATIAPLIGLSALRHRKWQAELLPSRALIFRSTVFISCGIYLLIMSGVGYFIRQWGGTWGTTLQIAFFTGSLIVLYLMLSSGKFRASLKLFIAKNFFKLRYDYREEWIKFSTLLSVYDDHRQIPKRVIKALAGMMESPRGILFEWEDKRGYILKACWNHPFPNKDVVIEPCAFTDHIQQTQRALELPSPLHIDNPALIVPSAIRQFDWAWLLAPLFHGNRLHAFVLLAHPRIAFFSLDWEVLDLLSMAGRQAAICLVQEQNANALAVAKQFEEYNRLSAFVIHDLKNVHSQLNLIQSNRVKHEHNPAFVQSVFHTIEHVADKIGSVLIQMRAKQQQQKIQEVDVAKVLEKVVLLSKHRQPVPRIDWKAQSNEIKVLGEDESFINILCHLVENAQQATPPHGDVILSVSIEDQQVILAIQDTGCGMESEFIHISLYRPFVTTKGDKGTGIGVYEAKEYLHSVGAKLTVETIKNQGSIFRLEFPLALTHSQQSVA